MRMNTAKIFVDDDGNKYYSNRKLFEFRHDDYNIFYQVEAGDTLYLISYKFYGKVDYWWVIADYNNIYDVFDISSGDILVIPPMELINKEVK